MTTSVSTSGTAHDATRRTADLRRAKRFTEYKLFVASSRLARLRLVGRASASAALY